MCHPYSVLIVEKRGVPNVIHDYWKLVSLGTTQAVLALAEYII